MGAWSPGGFEHMRWSSNVRFIVGGASMTVTNSASDVGCCNYQFYLERFDSSFTKIEKIVQVSHAPLGLPSFNGDAWFGSSGGSSIRSNHYSPAIGSSIRSAGEGFVYDVQGRRIKISRLRPQEMATVESNGLFIEHGQLRLIGR
jgi:hypothetical protein